MGDISRSRWVWKWTVCLLLLFATMLNYMDRMTFNQLSPRITAEFDLNNAQYGDIEAAFAIAFATGAILGGLIVDRWNVWWVYPCAVFGWSLAGAITALAHDYPTLLVCRSTLGFIEAFHWPCGLRTTQRILSKQERTLGNSILQSGAAIGAAVTPLTILVLLSLYNDWRPSFIVIGAVGIFWVVLWLLIVRPSDLALPQTGEMAPVTDEQSAAIVTEKVLRRQAEQQTPIHDRVLGILADRRFWVLALVVVSINTTWHFFRAWLPRFLQQYHGYSETDVQYFSFAYYLMSDVGSLAAGFITLWLARGGLPVKWSRMLVFGSCALITTLSLFVGQLDAGSVLLGILVLIGFGALGLFPNYYSFTQELTVKHQGKVTGSLGCINWIGMFFLHAWAGRNIDATQSYAMGLTLAGLAPLVGLAALLLFWHERDERPSDVVSTV